MLIASAYAQGSGAAGGAGIETIILFGGFFVLMYFLMIRPQMKRQKEHRQIIENLQQGDEVLTASGLVGRITALDESYVSIEVAPNTEISVQRAAVQQLLPKNSLKSIRKSLNKSAD